MAIALGGFKAVGGGVPGGDCYLVVFPPFDLGSSVADALGGFKVVLQWQMPLVVSRLFVVVIAIWLFFPPLVRNNFIDKGLEEHTMIVNYIKKSVKNVRI
ncbi:hypothetical protein Patl1_04082 [Pistacia atlantica]|uniref:Uncharacterized protein n=1 Tax=Pistacia atlantica TaxID=434234 RepID=A0ACC1BPR4_9ROSI|nr:hypothetical protein Patl1_04082 [Pistacia atlantica]